MSGFLRPGTLGGRPKTIEQAVRTARSRMTARYVVLGGLAYFYTVEPQ